MASLAWLDAGIAALPRIGGVAAWASQWAADETPVPLSPPQGHRDAVRAVSLSPGGQFCVSAGVDKTVRIFTAPSASVFSSGAAEVARPCVHGCELYGASLVCPTDAPSEMRLAIWGDEPIVRFLDPTVPFLSALQLRTGCAAPLDAIQHALGAVAPALKLEAKAIFTAGDSLLGDDFLGSDDRSQHSFVPVEPSAGIPSCGDLSSRFLWPEAGQIAGIHTNVSTVAFDTDSPLVAISNVAERVDESFIDVFSVQHSPLSLSLTNRAPVAARRVGRVTDVHDATVVSLDWRGHGIFAAGDARGLVAMYRCADEQLQLISSCRLSAPVVALRWLETVEPNSASRSLLVALSSSVLVCCRTGETSSLIPDDQLVLPARPSVLTVTPRHFVVGLDDGTVIVLAPTSAHLPLSRAHVVAVVGPRAGPITACAAIETVSGLNLVVGTQLGLIAAYSVNV
jgi:WD40 repeat protein